MNVCRVPLAHSPHLVSSSALPPSVSAPPLRPPRPPGPGDGAISEDDLEIVLRQLAGSSLSDAELKSIIAQVCRREWDCECEWCPTSSKPSASSHHCCRRSACHLASPFRPPLRCAAGDAWRGGWRAGFDVCRVSGGAGGRGDRLACRGACGGLTGVPWRRWSRGTHPPTSIWVPTFLCRERRPTKFMCINNLPTPLFSCNQII